MSDNNPNTTIYKCVFNPDQERMEAFMKAGYTWFDMMYPRGSDAEARELKTGPYRNIELEKKIKAERDEWTTYKKKGASSSK
jgi:hypothetical protein